MRGRRSHRSGALVNGVLDGVDCRTYDGVWKLWKAGSIGIFAVFVLVLADVARTLRRIERRRA